MQNTVLTETLNTFKKDELKHFEDFIQSPFHNKKTPVRKLFNEIKKYFPGFLDMALRVKMYGGRSFRVKIKITE